MISCFFGNSMPADCVITSIVPNILRQLTFPPDAGVITVCKVSWLESHPSPFLSGRKAHSQQLSSDTSLKGTWTSTLSAFSFQRCDRRTGATLSFPDPPTPPSSSKSCGPHHCTWCLCIGIGAFSFWQPCFQPFFCFSVLFL